MIAEIKDELLATAYNSGSDRLSCKRVFIAAKVCVVVNGEYA